MTTDKSLKNKIEQLEFEVNAPDFCSKNDFCDTSNALISILDDVSEKISPAELQEASLVAIKLSDFKKTIIQQHNTNVLDAPPHCGSHQAEESFLKIEQDLINICNNVIKKFKEIHEITIYRSIIIKNDMIDLTATEDPQNWFKFFDDAILLEKLVSYIFNLRRLPSAVNYYSSINQNKFHNYVALRTYFAYEFNENLIEIKDLSGKYKALEGGMVKNIKNRWHTRSETQNNLKKETLRVVNFLKSYHVKQVL